MVMTCTGNGARLGIVPTTPGTIPIDLMVAGGEPADHLTFDGRHTRGSPAEVIRRPRTNVTLPIGPKAEAGGLVSGQYAPKPARLSAGETMTEGQ